MLIVRKFTTYFTHGIQKSILYKREEYDLLEYFGDLGGLLEFLGFFGWAISSLFVSRLFQAALVKRAYRVQKYLLDRTPYYETSKGTGHLSTESDSSKSDDADDHIDDHSKTRSSKQSNKSSSRNGP